MPRSGVGIELLDDGRLLVGGVAVDGGLGAGAGHGRAQEDVDAQHDEEEHPEDDAEPQQPGRPWLHQLHVPALLPLEIKFYGMCTLNNFKPFKKNSFFSFTDDSEQLSSFA